MPDQDPWGMMVVRVPNLRVWLTSCLQWRLNRARQRCESATANHDYDDFHWQSTWLGKLIPWWLHWMFPLRMLGWYLPSD